MTQPTTETTEIRDTLRALDHAWGPDLRRLVTNHLDVSWPITDRLEDHTPSEIAETGPYDNAHGFMVLGVKSRNPELAHQTPVWVAYVEPVERFRDLYPRGWVRRLPNQPDLAPIESPAETPCRYRLDGMHCDHWWDGDGCHACGAPPMTFFERVLTGTEDPPIDNPPIDNPPTDIEVPTK